MLRLTCSSALAAVLILSAGQAPAQNQRTTGPVATYWVTVRTSSGLPTGGAGFDPMAMMAGGGVQKSLELQRLRPRISRRTGSTPASCRWSRRGANRLRRPPTSRRRPGAMANVCGC